MRPQYTSPYDRSAHRFRIATQMSAQEGWQHPARKHRWTPPRGEIARRRGRLTAWLVLCVSEEVLHFVGVRDFSGWGWKRMCSSASSCVIHMNTRCRGYEIILITLSEPFETPYLYRLNSLWKVEKLKVLV